MINTYNESSLHRSLKEAYRSAAGGKTEQETGAFICDIVTPERIIEIQTSGLSALKKKLAALLPSYKVTVVFPLAAKTIIETCGEDGLKLRERKSSVKKNIFHLYRELTGLYEIIRHPNFTLEVLFTEQTDVRVLTTAPVQLANKSRRWKKNWYRQDRRLNAITGTRVFSVPADYLEPLLELGITPDKPFCVSDAAQLGAGKQAGLMLWVLKKMQLIFEAGKEGKKIRYTLKKNGT